MSAFAQTEDRLAKRTKHGDDDIGHCLGTHRRRVKEVLTRESVPSRFFVDPVRLLPVLVAMAPTFQPGTIAPQPVQGDWPSYLNGPGRSSAGLYHETPI